MIRKKAAICLCFALFFVPAAWAHGPHAPSLSGDPATPPPGATIVRDGAGRLLRVEFDADGDGRTDVWSFYENGALARQEIDDNRDGRVDARLVVTDGELVRAEVDRDGDGRFDALEIYAGGELTRQHLDDDGDGRFETIHVFAAGRHTRTEKDTTGDGQIDRWVFFDEGESPRLVEQDVDGDGVPDLRHRRQADGSFATDAPDAPTAAPAAPAPPPEPGDTELTEITVVGHHSLTAASDQRIRDRDFANLPRQNPSDLVRLIPGVHVSQHTGGAKAYQYFLRGFDAEHGQDLAGYFDGIPLNAPSQVHGHGYLDLHFLIPETIESIRVIKGPYDPEFGNFATAGAINFVPRRSSEGGQVGATGGMFGTARVLALGGIAAERYVFFGGAETDHSEGFTDPGDTDAYRVHTGQTLLLDCWSLHLMTNHYGQDSAASDVIPEKWVDDKRIDRYGSLDPSDRVVSNRHLVGLTADWQSGPHDLRLQGFFDNTRATIWSNYTFYLFNPLRGDQQEMLDTRNVLGANARYIHTTAWGATTWETAVGTQWRSDDVRQVLANSTERERWNVINDLDFRENALGLWLREKAQLAPWVALVPGARLDMIGYAGEGTLDQRYFNIYTNRADTRQDVARDWHETAWIASPKASVIFTPLAPWDVFLNYGEGFFSNNTLRMIDQPSTTIPKVRGAEVGTRLTLWAQRVSLAGAVWQAEKQRDEVFDPQTGLSGEKPATRRRGLDGELRVNPLSWLYLSTDASYVDALFADSGDRIPNGPITLMTNGVGWRHPVGARGLVRGRYVGPRELDQGDWAPRYYVVDLVAGYDTDAWGAELAIDNVLDTQWEDAVFSYETRPEPGGATYNGIHWTPGTPFFARFTVTAKF